MPGPTVTEIRLTKKRYLELRKLAEELYDWLKLHRVDYKKGECCKLKSFTIELLETD
uniref:Uncharacterized protein n=1 Tax=viral metagenome TaxID=1070528 RepID=A0A6M3LKG6_9ZZZZ